MEAAYGLAITLTMMMSTILFSYYMYSHKYNAWLVIFFLIFYLSLESCFLVANLVKFPVGGWVSVLIASIMASVMIIWLKAFQIKLPTGNLTRLATKKTAF